MRGDWHSGYEALHRVTSRDASGVAGFPIPAGYPVYHGRRRMRAGLEYVARTRP